MATFSESLTAILISQPFFGELLMRYDHVETTSLPTAAVSRREIFYNPTWWETLTDDEGVFVLSHEIMHVINDHLTDSWIYMQSGIGPDGKAFDQDRMNRAQDYYINAFLVDADIGKMPSMGLHSTDYPSSMTPMQIYVQLPPQDPNGKTGFDTHMPEPGDEADAVTAPDIVSAANNAKAVGKMPAGMDRLIDKLRKPTASPWARLRKLVMSAISGNDSSTWRKLNRTLISRGIGSPSRVGYGCDTVACVVDISGSISDDVLALFGGHMGAILTDARPRRIVVIWTEAQVVQVDTVVSGAELRTLLSKGAPGGGGTDMTAGIDEALKHKAQVCVVLTDMYTPFGDKPKGMPVLWASITPGIEAPYGETIVIT